MTDIASVSLAQPLETIADELGASHRLVSNALVHLRGQYVVRCDKLESNFRSQKTWFPVVQTDAAFYNSPELWPTVRDIQDVVAQEFGLKATDLIAKGREPAVTIARFVAVVLCRDIKALSYPDIGMRFGGRDHSTIMHAEKRGRAILDQDRDMWKRVKGLRAELAKGPK
jgi:hypothetical protein